MLDGTVAVKGPDCPPAVVRVDVGKLRHAVEIDQDGRLSQAQGKEWNKTLPAGKEFGVAAVASKETTRFAHTCRSVIVKRRGFHGGFSSLEQNKGSLTFVTMHVIRITKLDSSILIMS